MEVSTSIRPLNRNENVLTELENYAKLIKEAKI